MDVHVIQDIKHESVLPIRPIRIHIEQLTGILCIAAFEYKAGYALVVLLFVVHVHLVLYHLVLEVKSDTGTLLVYFEGIVRRKGLKEGDNRGLTFERHRYLEIW